MLKFIVVGRGKTLKKVFFLLIGLLILLSLTSCKKEEKEKTEEVTKSEQNTFSFDVPDSQEEIYVVKSANKIEEIRSSNVYRGGNILVKADLGKKDGILIFNVEDEEILNIFSFILEERPDFFDTFIYELSSSSVVSLKYDLSEEEIEDFWLTFKNLLNKYNEKKSQNDFSDSVQLNEESSNVMNYISLSNTEEEKENIILPQEDEAELIPVLLLGEINDNEIKKENREEEIIEEKIAEAPLFETIDVEIVEKKEIEEAKEIVVEEKAYSEKGNKVRSFNASLYLSPSCSNSIILDNLFALSLGYDLTPSFSLDLLTGISLRGDVPLSLTARYRFENGIYFGLESGVIFNWSKTTTTIDPFSSLLVGYEFLYTKEISSFIEAKVSVVLDGFNPRIKEWKYSFIIGGRYYF